MLALPELLSLEAFLHSHLVPVEEFDLGHRLDDLEAVVGFLCQRVPVEVQLLEEGEFRGQEREELVQIPQLVVPDVQCVEELVFLETLNVLELVVRGVDLLDAEISRDPVQVFQLH